MNLQHNWRASAVAGALALTAAGGAWANSIAAVSSSDNFQFSNGTPVLPGMTTPQFFNSASQRIVVTFSAECAVRAAAGKWDAWTDVDIVVLRANGTVAQTLAPTNGNGDAFCSSNGTAAADGWATNAITAFGGAGLPAGNYRVQVRARLNNGATGGWYGERSLVVWR